MGVGKQDGSLVALGNRPLADAQQLSGVADLEMLNAHIAYRVSLVIHPSRRS
jgi:hypothetical protein